MLVLCAIHASRGQLVTLQDASSIEVNGTVNVRSYRIEFDGLGKTIEKLIVEVIRVSIEQVLNSGRIANDLRPYTSS